MTVSSYKSIYTFVRRFRDDTSGSMTVFGLFFFLFSGILGAIALDVASLYEERTQLQVNADSAAHAALYNLLVIGRDEADSKTEAVKLVEAAVPADGVTLQASDITFGKFNRTTRVFTEATVTGSVADASNAAVVWAARVQTQRLRSRANPAPAFLFRLIGRGEFNIVTAAVAGAVEMPECEAQGFFAQGNFDMQAGNVIGAGVCIEANGEISMAPSTGSALPSTVEGAIVRCPYTSNTSECLKLPNDITTVTGLQDALQPGSTGTAILDLADAFLDNLASGDPLPFPGLEGDEFALYADPSYITNDEFVSLSANQFEALTPGEMAGKKYKVGFSGSGGCSAPGNKIQLDSFSSVYLVTPCRVEFSDSVSIAASRIVSLWDGSNTAISSSAGGGNCSSNNPNLDCETGLNGITFGTPGTVAPGEVCADVNANQGVQLIAKGDMSFPAGFEAHGSQIFSTNGDFSSAAQTDYMGTSVYVKGNIGLASIGEVRVACDEDGGPDTAGLRYIAIVG